MTCITCGGDRIIHIPEGDGYTHKPCPHCNNVCDICGMKPHPECSGGMIRDADGEQTAACPNSEDPPSPERPKTRVNELPPEAGKVVDLCEYDGNLFVACENGIWIVTENELLKVVHNGPKPETN